MDKQALSLGLLDAVAFTGGVSRSRSLVYLLEKRLGCAVRVSPDSQFAGALGAALLAQKQALRR